MKFKIITLLCLFAKQTYAMHNPDPEPKHFYCLDGSCIVKAPPLIQLRSHSAFYQGNTVTIPGPKRSIKINYEMCGEEIIQALEGAGLLTKEDHHQKAQKANWEDVYATIVKGIVIKHTPGYIQIGDKKFISQNIRKLGSFTLKKPLNLTLYLSKAKFTNALLHSGIYDPVYISFHSYDKLFNESVLLNQHALDCFYGSPDTPINRERAVELLRKSELIKCYANLDATRNLPIFLNELAYDYWKGENGVKQNTTKAIASLREAMERGHDVAKENLAHVLYVIAEQRAEQICDANDGADYQQCISWCRESYELGNLNAKKLLAAIVNNYSVDSFFRNNETKNLPQAIYYFRRAYELGNELAKVNLSSALYVLAEKYYNDPQNTQSLKHQAIELLQEATQLGDADAKSALFGILNEQAQKYWYALNGYRKNLSLAKMLLEQALSLRPFNISVLANLERLQKEIAPVSKKNIRKRK